MKDKNVESKAESILVSISDGKLGKSKSEPIRMRELLNYLGSSGKVYNFDTIYQRGSNIWPEYMKQNLIKSILANVPVGYIHLIAIKEDADRYNVCDGKQRWECVLEFVNNKFFVEWNGNRYFFNDIKKHPELLRQFMNYTWDIRAWEPMTILEQRDLFERINAMSSLNCHEKLYCPNFLTKSLLMYIFNDCLRPIHSHLRSEISGNERYAGIRWVHNLMYARFGLTFLGSRVAKFATKSDIEKSTKRIENYFITIIGENSLKDDIEENIINIDILEKTGLLQNVNLIENTAKILAEIIDFKKVPGKNCIEKNAVIDLIIWFSEHIEAKTLKQNQIKEHLETFHKIAWEYISRRSQEDLVNHQGNSTNLSKKMELINEIAISYKVDLGCKKKFINQSTKTEAYVKAIENDCLCPICNAELKEDSQYDHVNPSSKNSETSIRLVCKNCNQSKNDISLNQTNILQKYMIENSCKID